MILEYKVLLMDKKETIWSYDEEKINGKGKGNGEEKKKNRRMLRVI